MRGAAFARSCLVSLTRLTNRGGKSYSVGISTDQDGSSPFAQVGFGLK
jgi:hypothetical protein